MTTDLGNTGDWEPADTVSALNHAEAVLWRWDSEQDRLCLVGAASALGFGQIGRAHV